jgi:hypothetical protein
LVTQDMESFLEGLGGHSIPTYPVLVLDWKRGAEAWCYLTAPDDRLYSFNGGERVWLKGRFESAVPGMVFLKGCVLLPEDGGRHVHPFDPKEAAASDAQYKQWQEEMRKVQERRNAQDPSLNGEAAKQGLGIPVIERAKRE